MWCEALGELSDASPRILNGMFLGITQEGLELGEALIDRIEVGGVRRQEEELGTRGEYGGAEGPSLVPRLSMMTTAPDLRVGTRNCQT